MASSRAVLADIAELGLDPKRHHRATNSLGHLKGNVVDQSVTNQQTEIKEKSEESVVVSADIDAQTSTETIKEIESEPVVESSISEPVETETTPDQSEPTEKKTKKKKEKSL